MNGLPISTGSVNVICSLVVLTVDTLSTNRLGSNDATLTYTPSRPRLGLFAYSRSPEVSPMILSMAPGSRLPASVVGISSMQNMVRYCEKAA